MQINYDGNLILNHTHTFGQSEKLLIQLGSGNKNAMKNYYHCLVMQAYGWTQKRKHTVAAAVATVPLY